MAKSKAVNYWAEAGDTYAMYYDMASKRSIGWTLKAIAAYWGYTESGIHGVLIRLQRQGKIDSYTKVVLSGSQEHFHLTSILNIRRTGRTNL